ncbi:MAG TPA: M15 family metallopeptidase [Microvirga sp.]|jgi:hypothetical protein|nr:M15 family metallopeptidase [Microvirga sp.]
MMPRLCPAPRLILVCSLVLAVLTVADVRAADRGGRPGAADGGPGGVYANIPPRDEFGRDQLAMFREWNPDPIGRHQANLQAIDPALAAVVRKVEADHPGLRFVIGSGLRGEALQRKAVAWGWSGTPDSPHRAGQAVDLWPLDDRGRVLFDPAAQARIAAAMKQAAAALGVRIRWGGTFRGFRHGDRSHFELVRAGAAGPAR